MGIILIHSVVLICLSEIPFCDFTLFISYTSIGFMLLLLCSMFVVLLFGEILYVGCFAFDVFILVLCSMLVIVIVEIVFPLFLFLFVPGLLEFIIN